MSPFCRLLSLDARVPVMCILRLEILIKLYQRILQGGHSLFFACPIPLSILAGISEILILTFSKQIFKLMELIRLDETPTHLNNVCSRSKCHVIAPTYVCKVQRCIIYDTAAVNLDFDVSFATGQAQSLLLCIMIINWYIKVIRDYCLSIFFA